MTKRIYTILCAVLTGTVCSLSEAKVRVTPVPEEAMVVVSDKPASARGYELYIRTAHRGGQRTLETTLVSRRLMTAANPKLAVITLNGDTLVMSGTLIAQDKTNDGIFFNQYYISLPKQVTTAWFYVPEEWENQLIEKNRPVLKKAMVSTILLNQHGKRKKKDAL